MFSYIHVTKQLSTHISFVKVLPYFRAFAYTKQQELNNILPL